MNPFKKYYVIVSFLLLSAPVLYGQNPATRPFVLGETCVIRSEILSENRTLNIYLPDGYAADTAKHYPVIYLLDGSADEDFVHVTGIVQFLTMIGAMPNTIIVGIGNVDRRRDLTFPTTIDSDKKAYPTTGGSAHFISFIGQELQPYIRSHYRVSDSRTIIGQSLGGLLATEILLERPALFNNYIIVSPSLWWDAESLLKKAPGMMQHLPADSLHVYITVGAEGKQMETDAAILADILKHTQKKNLQVYCVPLPKENHLTILHHAVYNALETLNGKP